jgi:uncharacterized protein (TIGR00661 family)
MLKILYAAGNNENAKVSLSRFLHSISSKPYNVKIAAYKKSSPDINIDWTLDACLNLYRPENWSVEQNDNFLTYFQQVKYYAPDLIISDLEYFTSYVGNALNIPVWQCSSSLINYALVKEEKYDLGIFKKYSFVTNKKSPYNQKLINIIDNSEKNYVYSHFGDMAFSPSLKEGFEWIRPYHQVGKFSIPCQHNIVAGILSGNKKLFSILQKYSDTVVFSDFVNESYNNIKMKPIMSQEEYYCNLFNSRLFVCEGQANLLADAFYNHKYSVVVPNFSTPESIINMIISEKKGYCSCVYTDDTELEQYSDFYIDSSYNKHVNLLHEKIDELYG